MILTNAQLVLPGALLHGTVALDGPRIADVQPGVSAAPSGHRSSLALREMRPQNERLINPIWYDRGSN